MLVLKSGPRFKKHETAECEAHWGKSILQVSFVYLWVDSTTMSSTAEKCMFIVKCMHFQINALLMILTELKCYSFPSLVWNASVSYTCREEIIYLISLEHPVEVVILPFLLSPFHSVPFHLSSFFSFPCSSVFFAFFHLFPNILEYITSKMIFFSTNLPFSLIKTLGPRLYGKKLQVFILVNNGPILRFPIKRGSCNAN